MSGERSSCADPTPVARFVAPGPNVPKQTPGDAGETTASVGHEAGAALVCRQYELDAVCVADGLHEVDPATAWHAENMLHAHIAEPRDDCFCNRAMAHF